jgi:hypothetical protein
LFSRFGTRMDGYLKRSTDADEGEFIGDNEPVASQPCELECTEQLPIRQLFLFLPLNLFVLVPGSQ